MRHLAYLRKIVEDGAGRRTVEKLVSLDRREDLLRAHAVVSREEKAAARSTLLVRQWRSTDLDDDVEVPHVLTLRL